jgi:hypothetical protein
MSNPFRQISCYAAAAEAAGDVSVCDQAQHEGVRYQCYAVFAEYSVSEDVCTRIPVKNDEYRSLIDVCLSDVAKNARDPGICAEIATGGLRDSCILKVAQETNDKTLCSRIRDPGLKSTCTGEAVIVE